MSNIRAALVVATLFAIACREPVAPDGSTRRLVPGSAMRTLTGGSVTDIFPGSPANGVFADARALNNSGQVTGAVFGMPPDASDERPYRWSPGSSAVQIGGASTGTAWGADINDASVVAGTTQNGASSTRAFRASGSTMVILDTLPGTTATGGFTSAAAINASGQIVGSAASATSRAHAVLWSASNAIQDLGTLGGSQSDAIDINDAGQVIGTSTLPSDATTHYFIWSAATGMQDLNNVIANLLSVVAINNSGQIAGYYSTSGRTHAFLYTPGSGVRDLGTLGGAFSLASGLNDNGQVVGTSQDANGITHAFLWSPADGMEDVTTFTGVMSIRKLNDRLQTLTGSADINVDLHAPRLIQLRVSGSNQPPVASFSASCPTLQCTFDASGSSDDAGIVTYTWNWGTGPAESSSNPVSTHTFPASGSYSVTLTVSDAAGLTNATTKSVQVPTPPTNLPPSVTITAPSDGASFAQRTSVTFSGTVTDPEDGTLSGASLVWNSNIDGQIGTGSSFSTSKLSVATHVITLSATDSKGAKSAAVVHVTITPSGPPPNQPPFAIIASYTCTGQQYPHQCSFDASTSTDDHGIVSYRWIWGNGRSESHKRATVRNTWARSGRYLVDLIVTDAEGLTGGTQVIVEVP